MVLRQIQARRFDGRLVTEVLGQRVTKGGETNVALKRRVGPLGSAKTSRWWGEGSGSRALSAVAVSARLLHRREGARCSSFWSDVRDEAVHFRSLFLLLMFDFATSKVFVGKGSDGLVARMHLSGHRQSPSWLWWVPCVKPLLAQALEYLQTRKSWHAARA